LLLRSTFQSAHQVFLSHSLRELRESSIIAIAIISPLCALDANASCLRNFYSLSCLFRVAHIDFAASSTLLHRPLHMDGYKMHVIHSHVHFSRASAQQHRDVTSVMTRHNQQEPKYYTQKCHLCAMRRAASRLRSHHSLCPDIYIERRAELLTAEAWIYFP
jgi:hypothetical protein